MLKVYLKIFFTNLIGVIFIKNLMFSRSEFDFSIINEPGIQATCIFIRNIVRKFDDSRSMFMLLGIEAESLINICRVPTEGYDVLRDLNFKVITCRF